MPLTLSIPDSVLDSIRLPEKQLGKSLLEELAKVLYADGALSFGKARELAGMGKREFAQYLTRAGIARHYTDDELGDDLEYARRQ
ncbi:MAG: hypothetical protein A3K19_20645 [Lentisphaerae bacterium RIFOXYB12_FULL_65_16]|nr:MAG: hypothetical protein A3K18_22235 [Lentisphaerae bacterium RIFOXYA12_64_32]OGV89407.1 MAG: hypothetical protein A3K19_20645 [Lentisphaerae bacterium RIFOXYB12_FULL_65_16]